jgi:hypothetical protein
MKCKVSKWAVSCDVNANKIESTEVNSRNFVKDFIFMYRVNLFANLIN